MVSKRLCPDWKDFLDYFDCVHAFLKGFSSCVSHAEDFLILLVQFVPKNLNSQKTVASVARLNNTDEVSRMEQVIWSRTPGFVLASRHKSTYLMNRCWIAQPPFVCKSRFMFFFCRCSTMSFSQMKIQNSVFITFNTKQGSLYNVVPIINLKIKVTISYKINVSGSPS